MTNYIQVALLCANPSCNMLMNSLWQVNNRYNSNSGSACTVFALWCTVLYYMVQCVTLYGIVLIIMLYCIVLKL